MAGVGKRTKFPTIEWQDADFTWDIAPKNPSYPKYTWDEVELIQYAAGDDYSKWEDFDKKKLVKLVLKVYGDTITEEKQKEIKHFEQKIFTINHEMEKFMNDHKKLITFYEKGENKTK